MPLYFLAIIYNYACGSAPMYNYISNLRLKVNLTAMPDSSPFKRFFLRRLNYPGWSWETRIVSTLNFVLMLGITGFVLYLYFANK